MLTRCIIASFLLISACSSGSDSPWSGTNLAGFYKITSGTQHVIDNQGTDEVTVFTEDSGASLGVRQAGNILSIFECLGVPDKDLKYTCAGSVYDFDGWYGPYYLDVQGKVQFFENKTGEVTVQILGVFPAPDYTYTNILDVKLLFDEKRTTDTKAGVAG